LPRGEILKYPREIYYRRRKMEGEEGEEKKVVAENPAAGVNAAQEEDPMLAFLDNIVNTVQRMNAKNYSFDTAQLGEDGMKLTFSKSGKKKSFNLRLGGKKNE